ncbi:alginate O-acetyltransferase AlgX-related protein [Desulfovibrio inopinatus]|uniref:alginate O-acetyltransferase AlgX-related protein n=1 Tax=Desulfovibrio inopinatus TaxID=102109 RepID=UPI000408F232|nr:hypothetical protein [Desulfovibrio inopinatus]
MISSNTRLRFVTALVSSLIFLVLISLPLAAKLTGLASTVEVSEIGGKTLPEFTLHPVGFGRYFDVLRSGYLETHYPFRSILISWYNYATTRFIASSSVFSASVITGKDGWMYLAKDGSRDVLMEHRSATPLTEPELQALRDDYQARADWLAQRGKHYMLVVAPSKETIYPEYLPEIFKQVGKTSRLDQALDYLKAHSTLDVVDLRPVLLDAKKKTQIFYATDSHWNVRGAFVGYRMMMEEIRKIIPSTPVLSRKDFNEDSFDEVPGDLSFMLGLQDYVKETRYYYLSKKPAKARPVTLTDQNVEFFQPPLCSVIEDSKLPRGIFFHDSFFWELLPFVAESFSEGVYVWMKPPHDGAPRFFDKALITEVNPDIVVDEITERFFLPRVAQ